MRIGRLAVCGALVVTAATASAQTKFSGTQTCAKPAPNYTVAVNDRGGHFMSLTKDKCTWTKGEIEGIQLKEDDDTIWSDITGMSARDKGYGVVMLANGDKAVMRFEGTTVINNDMPVSGKGTWTFVRGGGKLQGITGKGTYTGTYNPDGSATFEVEGEYQLRAAEGSTRK
jgi:hypothetical protein